MERTPEEKKRTERSIFDPFNDAVAREIRNRLSSAFVAELTGKGDGRIVAAATECEAPGLSEVHAAHIRQCRRQYYRIIEELKGAGVCGLWEQAVVLWNEKLYFEMHELLETRWHLCKGVERAALKGWIQAAGAYMHHARGKPDAAAGLAMKARRYLKESSGPLGFIENLDALIEGLKNLSKPPPILKQSPCNQTVPMHQTGRKPVRQR